ncbi:unnamed protein product, partial [Larinioides sclopetarius]
DKINFFSEIFEIEICRETSKFLENVINRKTAALLPRVLYDIDFLNVDSDVIYTEEVSDDEIINNIMNENEKNFRISNKKKMMKCNDRLQNKQLNGYRTE